MVVYCELYLCNINRLNVPEEVHQQSAVIICLKCQDRIDRGLNPRRSNISVSNIHINGCVIVIAKWESMKSQIMTRLWEDIKMSRRFSKLIRWFRVIYGKY